LGKTQKIVSTSSEVGKNTKGGFNVPLSHPQCLEKKLQVVAGEGWGEGERAKAHPPFNPS